MFDGSVEFRIFKIKAAWFCIGALCVACTSVLAGWASSGSAPTIRTQRIELVDGKGKVRARLSVAISGKTVEFAMVNSRGEPLVQAIANDQTGAMVSLTDTSARHPSSLNITDSGFALFPDNSVKLPVPQAALAITPDGPVFTVMNRDGNIVWEAPRRR